MGKNGADRSIADLMKGIEGIFEEVERLDAGAEGGVAPAPRIDGDTARGELRAVESRGSVSENGRFEVRIADGGMKALADLHPPKGDGEPISLEEFEKTLKRKGVVYGVDWQAVRDAVLRCNVERVTVIDAVVARGTLPRDEEPARILIEQTLQENAVQEAEGKDAVDYKSRSPFQFVKKGDVLARIVPKQKGTPGMNVKGMTVPFAKKSMRNPRPGKNTGISGSEIVATCSGRFAFSAGSFYVREVLDVTGDIDYSTGHVDFPGDVMIAGEVKRGFKLKTGGSLFCAKVIDATEVECGGELVTSQGIIGRGSGIVKAAGGIRARFIENCYVEAKGSIQISTGCLNSIVHTLDKVEAGIDGVIVGGTIVAQNGITAGQLGAAAGTRTEVKCGIDYTVSQKLAWIREKNTALALKLKETDNRISDGQDADGKLSEFREKLKAAVGKLNEAARTLVMGLDKNEEALIAVHNTVHPGTRVEICNVTYSVGRPLKHVIFYLDKKSGKVAARSLTRSL